MYILLSTHDQFSKRKTFLLKMSKAKDLEWDNLNHSPTIIVTLCRLFLSFIRLPISAESANCRGPDNELYHCVELTTTLSYTGPGTPDTFHLQLIINMDLDKISKRTKILNAPGGRSLVNRRNETIVLRKGEEKILSHIVYVKVDKYGAKADIFTPMSILTSYSAKSQACPRGKLCPILPKVADTVSVLGYAIKCSNSSFCKPYLRLSLDGTVLPETEGMILRSKKAALKAEIFARWSFYENLSSRNSQNSPKNFNLRKCLPFKQRKLYHQLIKLII